MQTHTINITVLSLKKMGGRQHNLDMLMSEDNTQQIDFVERYKRQMLDMVYRKLAEFNNYKQRGVEKFKDIKEIKFEIDVIDDLKAKLVFYKESEFTMEDKQYFNQLFTH